MKLKFKIWLDEEGKVFGEGPYRLLKGVQITGSLAQAAKEQNMSYSRAHGLMKLISVKLGFALIEGHAGGSGGGGACVTPQAEDLMRRYEEMIIESTKSLESIFNRYFGPGATTFKTARPNTKQSEQEFCFPANWKQLTLEKGEVVALTGAGGKSSIMYRLAGELSRNGAKVLLTTTTMVYLPEHGAVHRLLIADEQGLTEQLRRGIKPQEIVAIGSGVREGKLIGISPQFTDTLAEMAVADYILVEADGAAGLPFKAPDTHEPMIPQSSMLVLNVVGLDALETPLAAKYCHRPALIASICGLPLGAMLDAKAIADVMFSTEGGRKNIPRGAQWLPVINKIDNKEDLLRATQIARALLKTGAEEVVFASTLGSCLQVRLWGKDK